MNTYLFKHKCIVCFICISLSISAASARNTYACYNASDTLRPPTSEQSSAVKSELINDATEDNIVLYGDGGPGRETQLGTAAIVTSYSMDDLLSITTPELIETESKRMERFFHDLHFRIEREGGRKKRDIQTLKELAGIYQARIRQHYSEKKSQLLDSGLEGQRLEDGFALLCGMIKSDLQEPERLRLDVRIPDLLLTIVVKAEYENFIVVKDELVRHYQELDANHKSEIDSLRKTVNFFKRVLIPHLQRKLKKAHGSSTQSVFEQRIKDDEEIAEKIRERLETLLETKEIFRERPNEANLHSPFIDALEQALVASFPSNANALRETGKSSIYFINEIYNTQEKLLKPDPASPGSSWREKLESCGEQLRSLTGSLYCEQEETDTTEVRAAKAQFKMYQKVVGGIEGSLEILHSLAVSLREAEDFRIEIKENGNAEHNKRHILFCDDITPQLVEYISNSEHKFIGICTTRGTLISHWAIAARGKGISVIILDINDKKITSMVKAGDLCKIETEREEGASFVSIRVPPKEIEDIENSVEEDRLYGEFAKKEAIMYAHRTSFPVYTNTANPVQTKTAKNDGTHGIGLYRSENLFEQQEIIDLVTEYSKLGHDSESKKTIRDRLSDKIYEDLHSHIEALNDHSTQRKPFKIRTPDLQWDKSERLLKMLFEDHSIPVTGFDFYLTSIGNEVLQIFMEAVIKVANKTKQLDYNVDVEYLLPNVKDPNQVSMFFADSVFLNACRELKINVDNPEGLNAADFFKSINRKLNLSFGIMCETAPIIQKMVANGDAIFPYLDFVSVGDNDLTEDVLSAKWRFAITREDEHFKSFFFELLKDIITGTHIMPHSLYNALIQGYLINEDELDYAWNSEFVPGILSLSETIAGWNAEHPENRISLGFCGGKASEEKYALIVAGLKKRHGENLDVYLSTTLFEWPRVVVFLQYLEDTDLSIIDDIEADIDIKALEIVGRVLDRLRSTEVYQREITEPLEEYKARYRNADTAVPANRERDAQDAIAASA